MLVVGILEACGRASWLGKGVGNVRVMGTVRVRITFTVRVRVRVLGRVRIRVGVKVFSRNR